MKIKIIRIIRGFRVIFERLLYNYCMHDCVTQWSQAQTIGYRIMPLRGLQQNGYIIYFTTVANLIYFPIKKR